jgi:hypothetical protein
MKSFIGYGVIFIVTLVSFFSINANAQTQSTLAGGSWDAADTWISGVVPTASDDVIINGPVVQDHTIGYTIYPDSCRSLIITANGSLKCGAYGGGTGTYDIVVSGNVVNNGSVTNKPDGDDLLEIKITGNIENNGVWQPYRTIFHGPATHQLKLGMGKSFGSMLRCDSGSVFSAMSNMTFTFDFTLNNYTYIDNFDLNNGSFFLNGDTIETKTGMVYNGTIIGDCTIKGTFNFTDLSTYPMSFQGSVTNLDTIVNAYYGGGAHWFVLPITGNFTNNGVVKNFRDGNELDIQIKGDLINNGPYHPRTTRFIGTNTQHITMATGDTLYGQYIATTAKELISNTDLIINGSMDLNGDSLEMNNHLLEIDGSLSNAKLFDALLKNGLLTNVVTENGLTLSGTVTLEDGNVFNGGIVNDGMLRCNSYGGGARIFVLNINGPLHNNDTITDMGAGWMLYMYVTGNIHNSGVWSNSRTYLTGTTGQSLYLDSGMVFGGDFYNSDSGNTILALTNLIFTGNVNLSKSTLNMNGHTLRMQPGEWLYGGSLQDAKMVNGSIDNLKFLGTTELSGNIFIQNQITARSNITIQDTVLPKPYSGGSIIYPVSIVGNVLNNGLVQNTGGWYIDMTIAGNVTNKGIWNPRQNTLLFYVNDSVRTLTYYNTTDSNITANGAAITGSGASSFSIISGGGTAVITPGNAYAVQILFTHAAADTTAALTIDCPEMLSFNTFTLAGNLSSTVTGVHGNGTGRVLPSVFALKNNYPNPFNPATAIDYQLASAGYVTMFVYNSLGQEIKKLVDGEVAAGYYTATWNAGNSASGVYFVRFTVVDNSGKQMYQDVKKLMLIK